MIHGSVTASCNYASETFLDGTPRERFRLTSMRSDTDRPTSDDRFDSLLAVSNRFEISRGWIENDNYVSHTKKELQLIYSSGLGDWLKMDLRFFAVLRMTTRLWSLIQTGAA
jgi:hypothetical protein